MLDCCEITGVRRSHTGIHNEPHIGIVAMEGGLEEDLFSLMGVRRTSNPHILRFRWLEEWNRYIIADVLLLSVTPMHNLNCRLTIHFAGKLHLGHLVSHNDSARVALGSSSDGIGVAERALMLLWKWENWQAVNLVPWYYPFYSRAPSF